MFKSRMLIQIALLLWPLLLSPIWAHASGTEDVATPVLREYAVLTDEGGAESAILFLWANRHTGETESLELCEEETETVSTCNDLTAISSHRNICGVTSVLAHERSLEASDFHVQANLTDYRSSMTDQCPMVGIRHAWTFRVTRVNVKTYTGDPVRVEEGLHSYYE